MIRRPGSGSPLPKDEGRRRFRNPPRARASAIGRRPGASRFSRAFPKSAGPARSAIAKSAQARQGIARRMLAGKPQRSPGPAAAAAPLSRSAASTASQVGSASITCQPADSKSGLPLGATSCASTTVAPRQRSPFAAAGPTTIARARSAGPADRPAPTQSPSPSIHSPKSAFTLETTCARSRSMPPCTQRCPAAGRHAVCDLFARPRALARPCAPSVPIVRIGLADRNAGRNDFAGTARRPTAANARPTAGWPHRARTAADATHETIRRVRWRYSAVRSIRSNPPNRRLVRTASSASAGEPARVRRRPTRACPRVPSTSG